jgi:protein-disulfide isomerase
MAQAHRTVLAAGAILLGVSLLARSAVAQAPRPIEAEYQQLRAEIDSLKIDLETIKRDLATIQRLLAGQGARADQPQIQTKIGIAGSPMLGEKDAPVTIAEFSDYQCPFCGRFFSSTFSALKTDYIDTGKVRYVFRDFPLEQIHGQARKAHEAAYCAGDQGKYWEMHDLLFQNQTELKMDVLKQFAEKLRLAPSAFATCLTTDKYAGEVDRNLREGTALNVNGTPTFFIGKSTSDDAFDGASIVGAQPIGAFRAAIDDLLKATDGKSQ